MRTTYNSQPIVIPPSAAAKQATPSNTDPLHGSAPEVLQARVRQQREQAAAVAAATSATGEDTPISERQ